MVTVAGRARAAMASVVSGLPAGAAWADSGAASSNRPNREANRESVRGMQGSEGRWVLD